jgi:endoglucanase
MENTRSILQTLTGVTGLSGYEGPIRETLRSLWNPLTDELALSPLGSLHGLKSGSGPAPRRSLMIATHMDVIGLMVSAIEDGLLRVTEVGGIDNRVLPGLTVTVHTKSGDLPGLVVQPPGHTLPDSERTKTVALEYLLVDTGLLPTEVTRKVQIGDLVSFAYPSQDMGDGYLTSPALDNRASITALTEILQILQKRIHTWDIWAAATVQEELHLVGAGTSAFQICPDLAIVIDVTFGAGPGSPGHETVPMDTGPTLEIGPSTNPQLHQVLYDLAKDHEIPIHRYAYPRSSGTDADTLQLAAEGVLTAIISIPIRYMHTPVEVVQLRDIQRTVRLVTAFIDKLDHDFLPSLSWGSESEAA